MHDLDSYLMRCYQLLLRRPTPQESRDDEELCACTTLVERVENH